MVTGFVIEGCSKGQLVRWVASGLCCPGQENWSADVFLHMCNSICSLLVYMRFCKTFNYERHSQQGIDLETETTSQ